jgi:acyl carrier protein
MSKRWLRRVGRSLWGRPPAAVRPAAEAPPAARRSGPLSHGEIVETLRLLVVQHSDGTRSPEDVGAGDHLYDRGHVDSMGGVALLTFIEDHYGVAIDEADLVTRLHTLDALARHILASVPPAQP